MKHIVEVNNTKGAFQILIFDTQVIALNFISILNSKTTEHCLTAYDRGPAE